MKVSLKVTSQKSQMILKACIQESLVVFRKIAFTFHVHLFAIYYEVELFPLWLNGCFDYF